MKAFMAAIVALIVITVGADMLLERAGFTASERFSMPDVRLD